MDVSAIPFAVSFPEFIKGAIVASKVLIALIGSDWHKKIGQPADPVRLELETAAAAGIPILPVLIGNTPMPAAEQLPPAIATITQQNAHTVGVLRDFDTHMRALLPQIESILGTLSMQTVAALKPDAVRVACNGVIRFLHPVRVREGVVRRARAGRMGVAYAGPDARHCARVLWRGPVALHGEDPPQR